MSDFLLIESGDHLLLEIGYKIMLEGTVPDPPTNCVAVYVATDQSRCTWTDNSHNENGFCVERRVNDGAWTFHENVGEGVEESSVYNVGADAKVEWRVRAYNLAGDSAWSTSTALYTTPAAPTDATGAVDEDQTRVTWTDNSTYESGFRIERQVDGGGWDFWQNVGANVEDSGWEVVGWDVEVEYRVRAFEPDGRFSAWTTSAPVHTPLEPGLRIYIDSVDWRDSISLDSIQIVNVLTRQIDSLRFRVEGHGGHRIRELQEVIVEQPGTDHRYFGGFVEKVEQVRSRDGIRSDYIVDCADYTWLLEHPVNLVNETYSGQSDDAMIQDFMPTCCPDVEVSSHVHELYEYDGEVAFEREKPRRVIEELAEAAGGDYYVDYGPTAGPELAHLHYFDKLEYNAPFGLSETPDMATTFPAERLSRTFHAPACNLVDVSGGWYIGEEHTFYLAGDGDKDVLALPYRIRAPGGENTIQVWVWDGLDWDGPLAVGAKYLHDDELGTTYDVLHSYSERRLEFDTAPPAEVQAVRITARQMVPVRVRVRSRPSYYTYGRWMADKIDDTALVSRDMARQAGLAYLAKTALAQPALRCTVREDGLRAGENIHLGFPGLDIVGTYLIQKVTTRFEAGGDRVVCDLELGIYDPGLVDILIAMRRLLAPDVIESDIGDMDELLELDDTFDLAETSVDVDDTGPTYHWGPANPGDDVLIWSFGRWS